MEIDEAVRSAITSASKLLRTGRTANIRLEEIESSVVGGNPVWQITLSSKRDVSIRANPMASAILGADPDREYKVFTVAKDTGEVLSMKIRLLVTGAYCLTQRA
jgi:hypothetical protein